MLHQPLVSISCWQVTKDTCSGPSGKQAKHIGNNYLHANIVLHKMYNDIFYISYEVTGSPDDSNDTEEVKESLVALGTSASILVHSLNIKIIFLPI